jgi:uncharacterized membrane protein YoaK (UPF0700 family)
MTASTSGELPHFPQDGSRRADKEVEQQEGAMTLTTFVAAPSQRALRTGLLVTLTLASGWTDALSYLSLGRVFSSFMTGNILFVGLSIAQGNTALLVHAGATILLFLVSITLGSLYLQGQPARQAVGQWRRTIITCLLVEGLVLLALALLWALTGNPANHPVMQVALLGIAAFGMGLQGALIATFNLPNVVSVALTGTELMLGGWLARSIGRQAAAQRSEASAPFLLALMLSYTLAALVVALCLPWIGTAFIPCLLVAVAVMVVLVTPTGG